MVKLGRSHCKRGVSARRNPSHGEGQHSVYRQFTCPVGAYERLPSIPYRQRLLQG